MSEHDDILARIESNTNSINSKLDTFVMAMLATYNKITYALIAVIAATLGIKLVGSPPSISIFTYATLFAIVMLTGSLIQFWSKLSFGQKLTRFSFLTLMCFSAGVRIFIYKAGIELAPSWYPQIIDLLMTLVATVLIFSSWRDWNKVARL